MTVAPGTAIDSDGHQLVLAQATTVDLPGGSFNDKQGVEIYISYLESAEDAQTVAGSADFTRWLERPQLHGPRAGRFLLGHGAAGAAGQRWRSTTRAGSRWTDRARPTRACACPAQAATPRRCARDQPPARWTWRAR